MAEELPRVLVFLLPFLNTREKSRLQLACVLLLKSIPLRTLVTLGWNPWSDVDICALDDITLCYSDVDDRTTESLIPILPWEAKNICVSAPCSVEKSH